MRANRFFAVLLILASLLGAFAIPVMAEDNIKVLINGTELFFDVSPRLVGNKVMVPMRKIFTELFANIDWDNPTQTVTATCDDTVIVMQIGNAVMNVNGQEIVLDAAPQLIDGRTLVPVNAVEQGLDAWVEWNAPAQTVAIIKEEPVIAVVNGEKVFKGEFMYYLVNIANQMQMMADQSYFWDTEIDGKKATELAMERAFEQAVELKVLKSKALEFGLTYTQDDLDNLKSQKADLIELITRPWFELELTAAGLTEPVYDSLVADSGLAQKVYQKITKEYAYGEPTQEEMFAYFRENYRKAKHILVPTIDINSREPLSDEAIAAAKVTAEEVYEKVKAGEDFDTLIEEYSKDPGQVRSGKTDAFEGYLFPRGQMDLPFENAAFALAPGEVSEIVESMYGYHIIMGMELTDQDFDFESYAPSLQRDMVENNFKKLVEEYKESADIQKNEYEWNKIDVEKEAENFRIRSEQARNKIVQMQQNQSPAAYKYDDVNYYKYDYDDNCYYVFYPDDEWINNFWGRDD